MGPFHCLVFKRTFYNEGTKIGRSSKIVNRGLIMSLLLKIEAVISSW